MAQPRLKPNADLASAAAEAEARYITANPKSKARAEKAAESMPGGNTRTVLHYGPFPLTLVSGEGCTVSDLDGHSYTDFLGEYTAGLYGHSHPKLKAAIKQALDGGVVLGGPNAYEAELARLMCERFPSIELIRFCNSGTEANLFAISTARMHTGRDKVMVFNGAYHGGVFYFGKVKPPINAPFDWVISTYNDTEQTLGLIDKHASELAAVVIEPMMGGGGGISAEPEFLRALREATRKHGIILVFDEVMTSRLSDGGLQKKHGVTPDLSAFGKYLGGGMTFGAFGGRRDIMARYDPYRADAVSHAGTFNNNVLSMAAGVVGLKEIYTPEAAVELNRRGDDLRARVNAIAEKQGLPFQITGQGSIMAVHFQSGPIRKPEDWWPKDDAATKRQDNLSKLFHLDMLEMGQYLARRGFISLSLPLADTHYDAFVAAVEEFLATRGNLL
ncbi:MAG: aminotransferase class III-fold pyridoxal phosphate-dependent enzyme [Hyphomicrobiaceae bacterium]